MSDKSFLGQGWSFPPTFLRNINTVVLSAEEENISQSLHVLFSTRIGERLMKFDYGTSLQKLVFEKYDAELLRAIKNTIQKSVLYHEPRIDLVDVVLTANGEDREVILVEVIYQVRSTNSRMNFVYPFHLKEGTNLGL